jgi:predicted SnoaL-like aldol condensation-catalyzing enzyme
MAERGAADGEVWTGRHDVPVISRNSDTGLSHIPGTLERTARSGHRTSDSEENSMTDDVNGRHASLDLWPDLWNGDVEVAGRILVDDFRIRFGRTLVAGGVAADEIASPRDFSRFITAFRAPRPELHYSNVQAMVAGDIGYSVWNARADSLDVGGVDAFRFAADGRIAQVWSVTGERPMG